MVRPSACEDVRKKIGAFLVKHPQFKRAEEEVRRIIDRGKSDGEADCLLITAPSGMGKTTLFNLIKREFPSLPDGVVFRPDRSPTDVTADKIPVLLVEMSSRPRPLPFVQSLLAALGDPIFSRGRFDDCCARLDTYLGACGTTAIVIDEVQRLVDHSGVVTSEAVLEELKRIHGRHGIALIFLGLGRIKYIFDQDVQLRDRWSIELRLDRFRCFDYAEKEGQTAIQRDDREWVTWLSILNSLQELTGLRSYKPLSSHDLAARLYFATGGVMRRLKKLLKRSLDCSNNHGEQVFVTLDGLFEAFADQNGATPNPFGSDFPRHAQLPQIDDDYLLRPSPRQRRANKAKAAAAQARAATNCGAGAMISKTLKTRFG